jgi:diguanylate cyclase (GGDEF)-like protein
VLVNRLLPLAATLPRLTRRALVAGMAAMLGVMALAAAHAVAGIGGNALIHPLRDWGSSVVYVIVALVVVARVLHVPEDRGPWVVLALGLTLYAAGNVLWALWLQEIPGLALPSLADGLWLSLYPMAYVGIAWLARRSLHRIPAGAWLDGLVAGLGIAAAGAAVVFHRVLESATGSAAAVATNLAYPIADLGLAALVMGSLSLRGWRLDRSWMLLGGGFFVLTIADCIYLVRVAGGSTVAGETANLFYMAAVALVAFAAWQHRPEPRPPHSGSVSVLLVPFASMLGSVGILAYDHFVRLDALAVVLALLTIVAGLIRALLIFHELRSFTETRRQALTDELTSLPNRRVFQERLGHAMERAQAAESGMALLLIDLDQFKELNDTLGHQAGDQILRRVGVRLRRVSRPGDTLARLGGDEFGLVLDMPADEAAAVRAAGRLRDALSGPFEVQGLSLRVDASIGVAVFPCHGVTSGDLMRHADIAMYEAKKTRTGCQVYEESRNTHSRERLALGGDLTRALSGREIEVHFQPKADARSGCVVGVEALARWRHPVHGLLPPSEFIALAEQTGLARRLTERVLALALKQCAAWRDEGLTLHVAVNVTVADLLDEELPRRVAVALKRHGLPPSALVIELTERAVLADPVRINDVLARLGELGVCLSLDDFGTGFSSLAHLKTLPVSEIKIDRSFVGQVTSDATSAAIVDATIRLAQSLGKRVVAEGVEDGETWRWMTAAGTDLIQGYMLSRPRPARELAPLLLNGATLDLVV